VVHAPLLLALSADAPFGSRRKAAVRIACRLEADLLLDELGDRVLPSDELVFHPDKQRVEQVSRLRYGSIILDESRGLAPPSEAAGQILLDKALEKGPRAFDPEARLESLSVRLVLIEQYLPEVEKLGLAEDALVETAVRSAASTRTSLADLAAAPLYDEFVQSLPAEVQRTLREDVPLEAVLRGGKRLSIRYEKGRQPWIESRLQDFFGMVDGPTICRGRLPLQIHFLAPNQRALQVTTDLRGFWERHYPELRRQLMRRYPKHLWPEDGSTAKPPTPGRIR
jgi:ATP-dependent helicase HrpB